VTVPGARLQISDDPGGEGLGDEGAQLRVPWRVEEEKPLSRVAVPGRVRQVGSEGVMIDERPLDAFEIEDHPQIERDQVEEG
jgi:hypothetical protein